jgi:hypothetical protein
VESFAFSDRPFNKIHPEADDNEGVAPRKRAPARVKILAFLTVEPVYRSRLAKRLGMLDRCRPKPQWQRLKIEPAADCGRYDGIRKIA